LLSTLISMPTCPACALTHKLAVRLSSTVRVAPQTSFRTIHLYRTTTAPSRHKHSNFTWASSTPANGTLKFASTGSGSVEHPVSRHETLTLLHKTTSILPRALLSNKQADSSDPVQSLEFWNELLAGAYDDLTSTVDATARIVGACSSAFVREIE
jgi:hypothetical protein